MVSQLLIAEDMSKSNFVFLKYSLLLSLLFSGLCGNFLHQILLVHLPPNICVLQAANLSSLHYHFH